MFKTKQQDRLAITQSQLHTVRLLILLTFYNRIDSE